MPREFQVRYTRVVARDVIRARMLRVKLAPRVFARMVCRCERQLAVVCLSNKHGNTRRSDKMPARREGRVKNSNLTVEFAVLINVRKFGEGEVSVVR